MKVLYNEIGDLRISSVKIAIMRSRFMIGQLGCSNNPLWRKRPFAILVSLLISAWRSMPRPAPVRMHVFYHLRRIRQIKLFHWRFSIAATGPLVHYITFGLLQRTLGELQRGCPQENVANPGQCCSSGLLRTSSESRCTTAAPPTLASDFQTHKVQTMRSDVRRFPRNGARVLDRLVQPVQRPLSPIISTRWFHCTTD